VSRPLLTWNEYAVTWAGLHGGVDPRTGGGAFQGWLRMAYRIGRALAHAHVGPAAVTTAGLVISLLTPVFASQGSWWVLVAAGLVLLSAVADSVDGALAVITQRTTRLGFVYDSLADRISELAWLAALKVVGVPGWLVVLCAAIAWLHEYLRARATDAGMSDVGVVTAAERPTRVVFAFLGLALGGVAGFVTQPLAAGTATAATAIWVLFGLIGFAQLLSTVHARLRHRLGPVPKIRRVDHSIGSSGRGAGGLLLAGGDREAQPQPAHTAPVPQDSPAEPGLERDGLHHQAGGRAEDWAPEPGRSDQR